MCGPLNAAFLLGKERSFFLLYHSGRIFAYMLAGLFFGTLGYGIELAGFQQYLSILSGIILISAVIFQVLSEKRIFSKINKQWSNKLMNYYAILSNKSGDAHYILLGFLNGVLPCGLVYIALVIAAASGSPLKGALIMVFFGFGTLPVFVTMKFLATKISFKKIVIKKWSRAFALFIAGLLILRGLNLGIPHLSPKISETKIECCEKPLK
jgi:sulfite exporter TauE/SafE